VLLRVFGVDAPTSSDGQLPHRIPRKPEARSEVIVARAIAGRSHSLVTRKYQSCRSGGKNRGLLSEVKSSDSHTLVEVVHERSVNLPAYPIRKSQIRPESPLILDEAVVFP